MYKKSLKVSFCIMASSALITEGVFGMNSDPLGGNLRSKNTSDTVQENSHKPALKQMVVGEHETKKKIMNDSTRAMFHKIVARTCSRKDVEDFREKTMNFNYFGRQNIQKTEYLISLIESADSPTKWEDALDLAYNVCKMNPVADAFKKARNLQLNPPKQNPETISIKIANQVILEKGSKKINPHVSAQQTSNEAKMMQDPHHIATEGGISPSFPMEKGKTFSCATTSDIPDFADPFNLNFPHDFPNINNKLPHGRQNKNLLGDRPAVILGLKALDLGTSNAYSGEWRSNTQGSKPMCEVELNLLRKRLHHESSRDSENSSFDEDFLAQSNKLFEGTVE
jgi:hypothetical protein